LFEFLGGSNETTGSAKDGFAEFIEEVNRGWDWSTPRRLGQFQEPDAELGQNARDGSDDAAPIRDQYSKAMCRLGDSPP
jgi:hypothetical protein